MTGRMDVVSQVSCRRRWSDAEKLEILAEAFRPGVRVCDVIARREVSSSLIYTWRKQLREGKLAEASLLLPAFAEIRVTGPAVPVLQPGACSSGFIHIELTDSMAMMATRRRGVSLSEIKDEFGCSDRTAQRMTEV